MRSPDAGTTLSVQPDQPEERNQKSNFETILAIILAIRLSGHTSGVASTDTAISGPMLECVYGGVGILAFFISLTYDCLTDRSERIGRKNVFEGHFSGIKAQYFISYILSFIGALMWMMETKKAAADQDKYVVIFAQIVLGASGFIVGKSAKDVGRQAKKFFQRHPQISGAVSHEPYAEQEASDVSAGRRNVVETDSINDSAVPEGVDQEPSFVSVLQGGQ